MADPNQNLDPNSDQVPDRRETIEAAFNAAEVEATKATPDPAPTPENKPDLDTKQDVVETAPTTPTPTKDAELVDKTVERAPQAWKEPLKAKWNKLDPDIRQEVLRRERETTVVLSETSRARQFEQAFSGVVQPYMARINALNSNPIAAVAELFKADHILSSGSPRERAQLMARLISDYNVNVQELDAVLSGTPSAPGTQVDNRVEQLLQQKLAPFQSFMQQQSDRERQERQLQEQAASDTITRMSQDAKYPHFEQLRSTMADLIEFAASKGQTLTIDTAYNRAVALDPVISQEVASAKIERDVAARLADSTAKAKRALNASVSVSGNPSSSATGLSPSSDRRATIEAAFLAAEGR